MIQLTGNVLYLASQLATLLALTWLTDLQTVGTYALAQAIASPVYAVAEMRLEQIRLTRSQYGFIYYVAHRTIAVTLALFALIYISQTMVGASTGRVLMAVGLYKALESLLRIMLAEHMRREQAVYVASIQVTRACATAGAFVSALYYYDLASAVLAAALGLIIPIVASGRLLAATAGGNTDAIKPAMWPTLRSLTVVAFPIGLSYYIGVLTVNLPRYVVEVLLGRDALALFSVAAYGVVLINTVVETTLQVTMPRLAKYWETGRRSDFIHIVSNSSWIVVGVGLISVVLAASFGAWILAVTFGSEYAAAAPALVALLVAALAQNQAALLRGALIAAHRSAPLVVISFMNFATVACFLYASIQWLALLGAGLALLLGQVVALCGYGLLWRSTMSWSRTGIV